MPLLVQFLPFRTDHAISGTRRQRRCKSTPPVGDVQEGGQVGRVCRPGHALQEDGLSQWSLDLIMRAS
jgi:hypothetical protein